MFSFLLVIHVIISIALAIVILMQSSKGGGLAGVFGGGGGGASGALFTGRGVASFLHKLTIGLATSFLILCLLLGSQIFKDQREAYDASLTRKARSQRNAASSSATVPVLPGALEDQEDAQTAAPAQEAPETSQDETK
ncbi:preprotein translocase subunit SecG [candidate division KSB1 bacterium]|nr:preprotein translocase subunit SecG [candidate division KSB1 bacterium]